MPIFRVEKTKNYTVMSNYHLKDRNLSLRAKGLLSYMLSLPDDWDYSLNGLTSKSKESIRIIRSTIEELKTNSYLIINKCRNSKGLFEYEYVIYEKPQKESLKENKEDIKKKDNINPGIQKPYMVQPHMEQPDMVDVTLLNTNILNTKKKNNKKKKSEEKNEFEQRNYEEEELKKLYKNYPEEVKKCLYLKKVITVKF